MDEIKVKVTDCQVRIIRRAKKIKVDLTPLWESAETTEFSASNVKDGSFTLSWKDKNAKK